MKRLLGAICFFGLLLAGGAAQASLIQNGSFENGPTTGANGYDTLGAGNTTIAGWTVGGGGVDYIGSYWKASEGSHSIDLSGNAAGSISQTFSTVVGQTYIVSFDLAGNPDGGSGLKNGSVTFDGSTNLFSYPIAGQTHDTMLWAPQTYSFVANTSSSTLTFASLTTTSYGPALDNVSVSTVPIPPALQLFSGALLTIAGITFVSRRRASAHECSLAAAS